MGGPAQAVHPAGRISLITATVLFCTLGGGGGGRRIPEASLMIPDLTIFCMAVHIIISFLVSFLHLSFLFLLIGAPKAGWDAKKQKKRY